MGRQICIAESKPRGHAVVLYRFEAFEGFIAQSPSAHRIEFSAESIDNRIDVGADVQAPDIRIVAYVHNDVNLVLRNDLDEMNNLYQSGAARGALDSMRTELERLLKETNG